MRLKFNFSTTNSEKIQNKTLAWINTVGKNYENENIKNLFYLGYRF